MSEKKLEEYYSRITEEAAAVGVGIVHADVIDRINIYEAARLAMVKAVNALTETPDYLLVDAMTLPLDIPQSSVIKGDAKSVSIAAGACIAKVTRTVSWLSTPKPTPCTALKKIKATERKNILKLFRHTDEQLFTEKRSLPFNLIVRKEA